MEFTSKFIDVPIECFTYGGRELLDALYSDCSMVEPLNYDDYLALPKPDFPLKNNYVVDLVDEVVVAVEKDIKTSCGGGSTCSSNGYVVVDDDDDDSDSDYVPSESSAETENS
jgi:hypothetical protein